MLSQIVWRLCFDRNDVASKDLLNRDGVRMGSPFWAVHATGERGISIRPETLPQHISGASSAVQRAGTASPADPPNGSGAPGISQRRCWLEIGGRRPRRQHCEPTRSMHFHYPQHSGGASVRSQRMRISLVVVSAILTVPFLSGSGFGSIVPICFRFRHVQKS